MRTTRLGVDGAELIAAAIDDLKEHGAPRGRTLRLKEQDVGRKLDAAGAIPRRRCKVGHRAVHRGRRIDVEIDAADVSNVGAEFVAAPDLDAHNLG